MDAALAIAATGGYDAVHMRTVAEHVGMAVGTLYRYFPAKTHLLVAPLSREFQRLDVAGNWTTGAGTPRQRLERLSSAWNQAKLVLGDQPDGAADDEPGVVVNPRRRARTPLTESQVDAIRTARANGESVVSICQRFNVHRMTVWTHTRDLF